MALKIVTINIPDSYLEYIEKMKQLGKVPSRSEATRKAIKHFLKQEPTFTEALGCAS